VHSERHDYVAQAGVPAPHRKPLHPLLHALIRLAILYAVVYAVCFAMEGAFRYKHGVGSITAIEKRFSNRGQRAKALVERQHRIDEMTNDLPYGIYITIVLFGTPFAMIFVIRHDIRLINQLMPRVWYPFRWWLIGTVIMLGGGLTMFLGPFMKAQRFYDQLSPAELIERVRR
jgi:hypothetical protein